MGRSEDSLYEFSVLNEQEVFEKLRSSHDGLSEGEATRRLSEFGRNELKGTQQLGLLLEFLSHFRSPLVIILLLASAISFALGDITNAIIISCIVIVSAFLDFIEERGAHHAARKLKDTVRNKVQAVREGAEIELPSEELCPGDVILLNAGKIVPADGRVLSAKDFFVNQSSLTGESFPKEKHDQPMGRIPTSLDAMDNMVLMGTNVVSGSARVILVKTCIHNMERSLPDFPCLTKKPVLVMASVSSGTSSCA